MTQLTADQITYDVSEFNAATASLTVQYTITGTDTSCVLNIDVPIDVANPQDPTAETVVMLINQHTPLGQLQWMQDRMKATALIDTLPLEQLISEGFTGVCGGTDAN